MSADHVIAALPGDGLYWVESSAGPRCPGFRDRTRVDECSGDFRHIPIMVLMITTSGVVTAVDSFGARHVVGDNGHGWLSRPAERTKRRTGARPVRRQSLTEEVIHMTIQRIAGFDDDPFYDPEQAAIDAAYDAALGSVRKIITPAAANEEACKIITAVLNRGGLSTSDAIAAAGVLAQINIASSLGWLADLHSDVDALTQTISLGLANVRAALDES